MLRRGREWLPDTGQTIRCPYTGAEVIFVAVEGGVKPVGAFDPDRIYTSAELNKAYHELGRRDGVPDPGTVEAPHDNAPSGIAVVYEEDRLPSDAVAIEETASRAKSAELERLKNRAAPLVAELARRRKYKS